MDFRYKKKIFKKKEKYLLIYSVESSRNELVLKQAIAVAKILQLKIYGFALLINSEGN